MTHGEEDLSDFGLGFTVWLQLIHQMCWGEPLPCNLKVQDLFYGSHLDAKETGFVAPTTIFIFF